MKPSKQDDRPNTFETADEWTGLDLAEVVPPGGSLTHHTVVLDSMHHDTADFALLRARLGLQRQTGTEEPRWQLELPTGEPRTDLVLPVQGRGIPAEFRRLTLGARAGRPLRAVLRIQTKRDLQVIQSEDGTPQAEVVIDTVTATRLGSAAVVSHWHEITIGPDGGDDALRKRIIKRIRKTGAVPSPFASTVARALVDVGPDANGTVGDLAGGDLAGGDLASAVRTYLDAQYQAILAGDLALRREQDPVHATRVASRRYRSVLNVFGDLFDAERASSLDAELTWYAGVLGAVRDVQVLSSHLRSALADLPDQYVLGPVSARLEQTLNKDLADAQRALATALRGRRYLALLTELQAWSVDPPLTGAHARPARRVESYLRRASRKLDRRLAEAERLPDHDPRRNDAFHRARKAAKRARYTAELARPVLGKPALTSLKTAKKLQSELGHRQDAVVGAAFLRRLGAVAGTTPGENGFTFGVLLAHETRRGHLDR